MSENKNTVESRENDLMNKWMLEKRELIHFCNDWDGMLICADSPEIMSCTCDFVNGINKTQRLEAAKAQEEKQARLEAVAASLSKTFLFPIMKEQLTLSDAIGYLSSLGPSKGTIVFETEEEVLHINFGDLKISELVFMLETVKIRAMTEQL